MWPVHSNPSYCACTKMASMKKSQSEVWKHFKRESSDADGAKCTLCEVVVKTTSGNTSNLHKHLKRHHDIETQVIKKTKRTSQEEGNSSSSTANRTLTSMWTKYSTSSDRHKAISKAIARCIVLDMKPLNSVHYKGFTQLIEVLEPRYNMESRTYITNTLIPEMYSELKTKIQKELDSATYLSLTTDAWTSRSTKSFTTVTAHFINEQWKLISYVLCTKESVESHTADNIHNEFQEVLDEWKIDKHKSCVTTDNAANITAAMERCGILNLKCMAHSLNLGSQKAIKSEGIGKVVGKVRTTVTHFRRSTNAANALRKAISQLDLPPLKPIIDVSTRWNSTLAMLERFATLRPAISVAQCNPSLRSKIDGLTERELDIVEQLIKVLQVLKTATCTLSSENQPTASLILPLKFTIIKQLNNCDINNIDASVHQAKMCIKHDLEER